MYFSTLFHPTSVAPIDSTGFTANKGVPDTQFSLSFSGTSNYKKINYSNIKKLEILNIF